MTDQLALYQDQSIIEQVVITGDLSKLTPAQRVSYYQATCRSLGLNPLTKPFDYISLNGKLTLYAKRDAADQLRKINGVSITKLERERLEDVYIVTAYAQDKTGRTDSSIGAVNIANLKGDALANAMMKAETKSKRRVTLSICGLGILDETEVETIPSARVVEAQVVEVDEPAPVKLEPVTGEVQPMPLDQAEAVLNSHGERYGDLDNETLSNMTIGIGKALKKTDLSQDKIDEYLFKRDAIQVILNARAKATQGQE